MIILLYSFSLRRPSPHCLSPRLYALQAQENLDLPPYAASLLSHQPCLGRGFQVFYHLEKPLTFPIWIPTAGQNATAVIWHVELRRTSFPCSGAHGSITAGQGGDGLYP